MPFASPLAPNAAMRWSVVRRYVQRIRPRSILEIGCGQGAFGARLARHAEYLGIEPDPTSFAVASRRIRDAGGQARNVFAGDLEPGAPFDLVCAFEVLEHLEDDLGALSAWREFVAPGGSVLLSMPAWPDRFNPWDEMVGHYRRYTPQDCERLLSQAGFRDVDVVVYGWPLGYATEGIRARIARRRLGTERAQAEDSMSERTAGSGRVLQPKTLAGGAVQVATMPFSALQRLQPGKGTGVVVTAKR